MVGRKHSLRPEPADIGVYPRHPRFEYFKGQHTHNVDAHLRSFVLVHGPVGNNNGRYSITINPASPNGAPAQFNSTTASIKMKPGLVMMTCPLDPAVRYLISVKNVEAAWTGLNDFTS